MSRRRHLIASLPALRATLVVTLTLAVVPGVAHGAPASLDSQLSARRAEAAKVEVELTTLRVQLEKQYAAYDEVSEDLEAARQSVLESSSKVADLDVSIEQDATRLDARVVDIYKSGGFDDLEVLLGTRSIGDFIDRLTYMAIIQDNDARLLAGLRTTRGEAAMLQQEQQAREASLMTLRQEAAARQAAIESSVAKQEAIIRSLAGDIARIVREQEEAAAAAAAAAADAGPIDGSAPPVPFKPGTIISDAVFQDAGSMSVDAIQTFLDGQSGSLRAYSGPDRSGATRSAAQMIADAATSWGVSPKVILATLQKEQSLVSRPSPSENAMDWAMGCGKAESFTIESYRGFGNQVWHGARVLAKNRSGWRKDGMLPIDGTAVYPTNSSTHSLYRYTPHFAGNTLFWRIYWRYFGSTGA
jgi:peptidoglycan hydrolase CwlO-like protein